MQLHEDTRVVFAAYKIPHPLEHRLLIKLKTDKTTDPKPVYNLAIDCLTRELHSIKEQFLERVKDACPEADFEPHNTAPEAQVAAGGAMDEGGMHGAYDDEYGTRFEYGAAAMEHDLAFDGA